MAAEHYKEWIVGTIDQLRQRKARPDLERISHMLERKHGIKAAETEEYIEKLVQAGDVVKVDYKGSTSYRNAAKWKKHHLGGQVLNSKDVSEKILEGIRYLTSGDPALAKQGIAFADIESWLQLVKAELNLVKDALHAAIDREAEVGKIRKLANGNYALNSKRGRPSDSSGGAHKSKSVLGKRPPGETSTPPPNKAAKIIYSGTKTLKSTFPAAYNEAKGSLVKRGRPASKRKRIKKNHGPDFESYDPAASEKRVCDYCLQTSDRNKHGEKEDLLVCTDCNAKAHPSCMSYSEDLASRARRAPWQCIDCKTCFVCQDAGDPDAMLFCDACDKGYHMKCHNPAVTGKPKGKWACSQCVAEGVIFTSEPLKSSPLTVQVEAEDNPHSPAAADPLSGPSCLPTPCDSPVTSSPSLPEDVASSPIPPTAHQVSPVISRQPARIVEDPVSWSTDDVFNYIAEVGFKEQAEAFREQEIDGQSLLLMRRSDVLTGLSIKLGPALKIYKRVEEVQINTK